MFITRDDSQCVFVGTFNFHMLVQEAAMSYKMSRVMVKDVV